jgi:hypothetical protein
MFRYYMLLAWRIMKRQKVYTAINILGLAIGVCACLVIYLVTSYDLSFDRFHKHKDRIFRITGEVQRPNGEAEFVNSVIPDIAQQMAGRFCIQGEYFCLGIYCCHDYCIVGGDGYGELSIYKGCNGQPGE